MTHSTAHYLHHQAYWDRLLSIAFFHSFVFPETTSCCTSLSISPLVGSVAFFIKVFAISAQAVDGVHASP